MTPTAYLLPLCVEWVILVTSLVPLVGWRGGNKHPNIAIFALFAALASAIVAALTAMVLAAFSVADLWTALAAEPVSEHDAGTVVRALFAAMAPWALLALAGITIAIVNLRIEPALQAARELHPRLEAAITPAADFQGVATGIVRAPAVLSFTTRTAGRATILLSSRAIDVLTDAEREAVLWHELGHIRGRHNALKLVAQALRQVAPRIAASAVLVDRLETLCEVAADNFAAKHVNRQTLMTARAKFD
ncbi:MAG: hypothetical protein RLZZ304_687 [Actinomycetota bacterium]